MDVELFFGFSYQKIFGCGQALYEKTKKVGTNSLTTTKRHSLDLERFFWLWFRLNHL